jgi:hypothetical protein
MRTSIDVTLAAGQPLFLRPGFDELPALDVELAAVAVDAAGNESAPTEPFTIRFDGCTLASVGDRCEDELDPDTDLAGVLGGGSHEPDASSSAAGVSCSFADAGPSPSGPPRSRLSVRSHSGRSRGARVAPGARHPADRACPCQVWITTG